MRMNMQEYVAYLQKLVEDKPLLNDEIRSTDPKKKKRKRPRKIFSKTEKR